MQAYAYTLLRRCTLQQGRPEAVKSAAAEQLDGSSAQPNSLEQDAKRESDKAPRLCLGLDEDPNGAEGGAGGPEDGDVWSDSISDAAGETTGDGSVAVMEASPTANANAVPSSISSMPEQWVKSLESAGEGEAFSGGNASAAPSSSSNTPEQWAETSHLYMQDVDEADSGWATVKPSRRRVRRQAESTAPASLHQATASAAAPVLKPKPSSSASRASGHEAQSPEAIQCSYDTQVRHRDYCGGPIRNACSALII